MNTRAHLYIKGKMRFAIFLPILAGAQLYASIEFHNVNPQIVLNSLDFLQSSLACPLLLQPANISLQHIYFVNTTLERLSFTPPIPLDSANCSATAVPLNAPVAGGRVVVGYNIPKTDYIYSFGVLSYNVHIVSDPTLKSYARYIGGTYTVSAAPADLLRWPTPYATDLPASSGRCSLLSVRAAFLAVVIAVALL